MLTNKIARVIACSLISSVALFSATGCDEQNAPIEGEHYTLIDLGAYAGGRGTRALDVNDSTQVVGYAKDTLGRAHSFLWENNKRTDLGSLGGGQTWARSINNSGMVAGYSRDPEQHIKAFIWENGSMTNLGTLGGEYQKYINGQAINNLGQVVGYELVTVQSTHGFIWEDGTMTDLGVIFDQNPFDKVEARAINDSGLVVGETSDSGWEHGFAWTKAGGMTDLGSGKANGLNNLGQIVGGSSGDLNNGSPWLAILWQDGVRTELPRLENEIRGTANDINEFGFIIGNAEFRVASQSYVLNAAIWRNGVKINLNDLMPANSGWVLNDATAVNNKGEIVGYGTFDGKERGFLLVPKN